MPVYQSGRSRTVGAPRAEPRCAGRYSFSLKTLFLVVTVFGIWLGWQTNQVRERALVIRLVNEANGDYCTESDTAAPGWRDSLLGDRSVNLFFLRRNTPSHLRERIAGAFPEATMQIMD